LDYLIRKKSIEKMLYIDPDVLITAPLKQLYEELEIYDIVLTPHLDTDYPDDGLLPDDGYILRAGVFNLGFIGINASDNAASFLSWWKSKLYNGCVVDVQNGYFVDQKFIDLAPVFFGNIFVEKDTGYNVAYWNLHSREISMDNGTWLCNGRPMYFFHFSGFNPERSEISNYIPSDISRHHFSNRPDLGPLFNEYKELLVRNGHRTASTWPYSFAYFTTGEPIPRELRIEYRNRPSDWLLLGNPFNSESLKDRANPPKTHLTTEEELNKILNSRAWHWASRYGRFKYRFLMPVYDLLSRPLRKKAKSNRKNF
jgi:hypothetical protein